MKEILFMLFSPYKYIWRDYCIARSKIYKNYVICYNPTDEFLKENRLEFCRRASFLTLQIDFNYKNLFHKRKTIDLPDLFCQYSRRKTLPKNKIISLNEILNELGYDFYEIDHLTLW